MTVTREDLARLMAALSSTYRDGIDEPEARLRYEVYWEALRRFEKDDVLGGAGKLVREWRPRWEERFPSPRTVIEYILSARPVREAKSLPPAPPTDEERDGIAKAIAAFKEAIGYEEGTDIVDDGGRAGGVRNRAGGVGDGLRRAARGGTARVRGGAGCEDR